MGNSSSARDDTPDHSMKAGSASKVGHSHTCARCLGPVALTDCGYLMCLYHGEHVYPARSVLVVPMPRPVTATRVRDSGAATVLLACCGSHSPYPGAHVPARHCAHVHAPRATHRPRPNSQGRCAAQAHVSLPDVTCRRKPPPHMLPRAAEATRQHSENRCCRHPPPWRGPRQHRRRRSTIQRHGCVRVS